MNQVGVVLCNQNPQPGSAGLDGQKNNREVYQIIYPDYPDSTIPLEYISVGCIPFFDGCTVVWVCLKIGYPSV